MIFADKACLTSVTFNFLWYVLLLLADDLIIIFLTYSVKVFPNIIISFKVQSLFDRI